MLYESDVKSQYTRSTRVTNSTQQPPRQSTNLFNKRIISSPVNSVNNKPKRKTDMPLCRPDCILLDIQRINTGQLADLNQIREDLEDLFYHEPAGLDNIMAKLRIVNNELREKLARACHLISLHRESRSSLETCLF